jgi:hypothetical protein
MERVLTQVSLLLPPGGRLIAALGGVGDMEKSLGALERAFACNGIAFVSPWEQHPSLSINAGFSYQSDGAKLVPSPQALPDGINGWYRTFAKYFNPDLTTE